MLNVKDSGAIGDGIADDTAALQATAAALAVQLRQFSVPGGTGEATFPSVVFPAGTYKISSPIEWGPDASLVADGSAAIQSTHAGPAFTFTKGYMVSVEGLTFINGTNAITFTNNNANGARLTVDRCRFQVIAGPAICACPVSGPYMSTHVTIRGCKWFACRQALVSWADVNTVTDAWIQWPVGASAANTVAIEIHGGRLNFGDTMLVPIFPNNHNGCAWVGWWGLPWRNSGAGIYCRSVLFHGEEGGLPPTRFYGAPDTNYPFQGASCVFRDCQLSCGQTSRPDTAAIQLAGGMPQTVTVDASSNIIGPCPLIKDLTGDGPQVLAALENAADRVRILIEANVFFPLIPPVPSHLQPYVRNVAL